MSITSKLLALCAMALTAVALTATSANADVLVQEEENPSGTHACPDIDISDPQHPTGGCHVVFESEEDIPLIAHITGVGEVQAFNCEIGLEARIASNGSGYVTGFMFGPPHNAGTCVRIPCDDETLEPDPWPLQTIEHAPSSEEIEMTFCLRPATAPPGSNESFCEVHLPLTNAGGHMYELSLNGPDGEGAECEVDAQPGVHIEISGHLISHEDDEDLTSPEEIEITHEP